MAFTTLTNLEKILEKKRTKYQLLLLFPALLLIIGCGSNLKWYKAGHTQRDFDVDSRQCEMIAKELAGEASLTRKPNIELYADQYAKCLMARGWIPGAPPIVAAAPTTTDAAAPAPEENWPVVDLDPDKRTLVAYGVKIQVPESFRFLDQHKTPTDLNLKQNYMWGGENMQMLAISIQRGRGGVTFLDIPFPDSPMVDFLYDESRKGSRSARWRAFCAQREGHSTGLVGTLYRVDDSRRIMVAVSIPLPDGLPEPGTNLRLTADQHTAMAAFTDQWSAWLEDTFPKSGTAWKIPFSPLEMLDLQER